VRRLAEVELPDPERADIMWLQRIELRSPRAVADALEAGGFDQAAGLLSAIFVDSRCGLIRWQHFGAAASCDPARTAACILRSATACHAHGIILVINDPTGDLASAPRVRALSRTLQLKGEAIEIFLLDHFVLGANGCRRLAEMQVQGRHSR
jgi:DNA repair protein RadC